MSARSLFPAVFAILATASLCPPRAEGAVTWTSVQWFTWNPAVIPAASTGTAAGQQITVSVSGSNAINPGSGLGYFDVAKNGTYAMSTPKLGLGAPKGGTTVTYTINLAALTIPTSSLVIGIANLDAINNRGSITVAATDVMSQVTNVNLWTTEDQFKEQAGLPSAQALVTRTAVGNNLLLGSVQGPDNTAWGDSRGIFFTGLAPDLATITLSHYYNHSNPAVADSITLSIGVVPEPSGILLLGPGAIVLALRRGNRRA